MPLRTSHSSISTLPDLPGEHPLSEGQRALWVLDRLDPGAAACHLAGAARVRGGLEAVALRRTLALLVERHAALRTTFEAREGEPVRRVRAGSEPDFQATALADPAEIPTLLAAEAFRPFDLEQEPLWRVRVWSLPDSDAVLLMAFHHLIVDYASVSILLRDLAELYGQERGGAKAVLPPIGPGMTEWIRRQEEKLAGPAGAKLRTFWLQRLGGDLPVPDLPTDRPRPLAPTWRGIASQTAIIAGGAEALRTLGRGRGATLFAAVVAGLQAVLHRWTGTDEVLVGVPAARRGPGFAHEIGYFVNPVVLRLALGSDPAFGELVETTGCVAREALAHGSYPFPRLARELQRDGDAGRSLLRVLAVLQPARAPEEQNLAPFVLGMPGTWARYGEISLKSMALPEDRVQSDLLLMAAETADGGLSLSLRLDADLFDVATAGRLLGHLTTFLETALAEPRRPVAEIDFLSPAERRQLAVWSAGPPSPEPGPCLHELIAEQAALTPQATALVHGEERVTYAELRRRATQLADHLRGLGVGPEVRVGVCRRRTPELVVGLLAVLEAGGAYVPIDPAYPAERREFLIEDSGAALVLTDGDLQILRQQATDRPRGHPSPQNLAYLIYTSGSTGKPKAVAIEHRSAVALALWARDAFSARELDGVLATTSVGFDLSVFELLVPLCLGGRVVLADSILDLPELPAPTQIRLINTVPSAMTELLGAGALPVSAETVNLAGEPLRRELVRALQDAGVRRVVNLYGPSEDTTYSTIAELDGDDDPPIGRPVAGTRARVLDARMQLVPAGVVGELFLGGAGLARGYLGRPELTAERFVPSPFIEDGSGARLYRTGDRARLRPDGELLFLGRLDHQVKIRGFRIEPGEVEAALVEHPEIDQAVVLAQGEGGERRLVAFVTPDPTGDLRSFLTGRLPEHLIPSAFVALDTFPRTPNGKIDRQALAALHPGVSETVAYAPPRTPLETALAAIWEEVLEVERVGAHDDFFRLGGHSLLALRVQARLRERLGVDLPFSRLFRVRTVAGLALELGEAAPVSQRQVEPRPRDGAPLPLSFAQEGFWLLHRLDPTSPTYHVAGEIRLSGLLDPADLVRALRGLARRHEALRTRYPGTPSGPVQVVEAEGSLEVPVVCLAALSSELREATAECLARKEAVRPFDLATAPPVRAALLRLGSNNYRLLLVLHHIAADEASLALLTRELASLSPPGQPVLQMGDVALWQRERMQGKILETQLAWWEERLAGLPPLVLPTDRPRPAVPGWRGDTVTIPLPEDVLLPLATLARREGATLFMVLLAGFQALLSRLSGSDDLAVGSPFSLRSHRELEEVVGPLLNTLVLRSDLSGDPPFRELLGRVRDMTVAAHEQAELPFELLVDRLRPERSPGANPLVQVAFVLHRPPAPVRRGDLEMEPRPIPTGASRLDLTLFALERPDGIELALEHAADLWDLTTAAHLLDHLAGLFAAVAVDPGLPLSALPEWMEAERLAILYRPEPAAPAGGDKAPRTPLEQLLAGIWEDVLGIERPGRHDDFFVLGGQSLLAARVVARLRQPLGVELPLRTLFEARTLAELAARVEEALDEHEPALEPPLVPEPRSEPAPLSFGQERLWFMDRLDPESAVYNLPAAVSLHGSLNAVVLQTALHQIAARHEILRTTFPAPGGVPVQVVAPRLGLPLPRVDLEALPRETREAEARRLALIEAARPFDLQTGPLLRTTLLRLGESEQRLLVTVHHIIFDGWSSGIFLRELASLVAGAPLPPLPLQFADFAAWQRRRFDEGALTGHLAWWRETLAGAPPVLRLPLDRPRPPVQTFRGGSQRMHLSLDAIRDLARRLEATPFMVFLSAWAVLLARYQAGTDLVIGTAVAGRHRVDLEPLIGLFAENLVLRLDLHGDPSFGRLVARARETTLAAWAHEEVPFERLVRELRPERDLSHAPFYQTALTLDSSHRPRLELPGLRLELQPVESGTAKLDLALYLEERHGAIAGLLEYNRDLFDATTAVRLLAAFERLVAAVPGAADLRISELPVLSEAERHQLVHELSTGDAAPEAHPALVPQLIAAQTAAQPNAPAVSGAGPTLSYRQLDDQAERLARRLRGLGVGPEVRVAVRLERSPELIVAMLGIWKAGGVYVPLDPTQPEERLAWIVADSGAAVVLEAKDFKDSKDTDEEILESLPPLMSLESTQAAYLIYTSGSTGKPKGVAVSHGALAAYAASVATLYGVRPGDRVLQSASVAFDLSLDEIIPALAGGAELVLRDDAMLSSVERFLKGCQEREITVLVLPTAYWHEVAAGLEAEDLTLPPTLRLVTTGGERLLPERLAAWQRRFPSGPLFNTYGPTEATIQVTAMDLNMPNMAERPEVPIGRPLPGAGVWLLDASGRPVPLGAPGEICLGGAFLARGYLGQPDRTAERFVPHPYPAAPGERLYRTGDLARFLPNGSLEFAGRIDAQVKVRGYRVEPGEVEAVLARHPGVAAATVIAWSDAAGRTRLAGYVVPRPPAPTAAELRTFLAGSLPEPLIPAEILFLDALPLTPHGKVDRKALPVPTGQPGQSADHVPPRDEAERAVATIWREALGVEKVGAHDNFFDLGGHSLVLARVHVLLKERLGREVSMVDLFRYPTVAALARHLALPAAPAPEVPSRPAAPARRPGRFLEARRRMVELPRTPEPSPPRRPAPQEAFLQFVERNPEALERASFAELEHHNVGSSYPLQPWPFLADRARVAEMEQVSTGIAGLIKSLPRRVFDQDPERLCDYYGLGSPGLARLLVQEPTGLAATIGRGDFLESAAGLQCLEFNMLSALGGWEAQLWSEAYLRVPLFARFLREERHRVACRDTVALLLAHVVAEARDLGSANGEINLALVTPERAAAHGQHLQGWLAGRYAEILRKEAPGAEGTLVVAHYPELRERAGTLWAGERRIHAAVELHDEGTAAQALRCFRAGTLKLFNAPIRVVLTDKRNLALLSELGASGELLSPAEQELVTRHVPWTRRLTAAAAERRGREVWLPELALTAREELVIKKARAGRGTAVHLGAATPEALWRERVEQALAEGDWIVQERIEPLPALYQKGERGSGPHDVLWGLFVLGDRYGGGFLSLAPREARAQVEGGVINVMRGATVGVIFEVLSHE